MEIADMHAEVRGLENGSIPCWDSAPDIWREVWIEEVHHSTGLGGNSLTRNEVKRLLVDERAVGSRLLVEYLYVRGYGDASRWVCQQKQPYESRNAVEPKNELEVFDRETEAFDRETQASETESQVTLEEVCLLHEQTTLLPWATKPQDEPGKFRERELGAEGITAVSWRFVPAEMENWLAQANELLASPMAQTTQELPELSAALARIHSRFVKTQPFATANGLVARLAVNLLLVRKGLPPAIIQKRQSVAYQQAMLRADLGNFTQLADLFNQGVLRSLAWFVEPVIAENLMPLSLLATEEINVAALRVAAARGRLKAERPPGGRWLSTPEWVADYVATRHQRRNISAEDS